MGTALRWRICCRMAKFTYCLLVFLVVVVAGDSSVEETDVEAVEAGGEILQHSVAKREARKKRGTKKKGTQKRTRKINKKNKKISKKDNKSKRQRTNGSKK